MESKNEVIKEISRIIITLLADERKCIVTANWPKLDILIRRKSKLLKKLEDVGFEHLNELYIFDPRIVEIKELVQKIVSAEDENATLLRVQMEGIKDQLGHVKDVLRTAVYGSSGKIPAPMLRQSV